MLKIFTSEALTVSYCQSPPLVSPTTLPVSVCVHAYPVTFHSNPFYMVTEAVVDVVS